LIRAFKREQGLIYDSRLLEKTPEIPEIFDQKYRWTVRQASSGVQRFLMEILSKYRLNADLLNVSSTALSEREAAASINLKKSDVTAGTRAIANEFGLDFISLDWEVFDFAIPRNIWFRHLFHNLMGRINSDAGQRIADDLGGYQISHCGKLVWGDD
jgi:molybdate-binding protein